MAAIPVSSSEPQNITRPPMKVDEIDSHERRLKVVERSDLEQRVRAIEIILGI